MFDPCDLAPAFRATEVKILVETYGFALSYLDFAPKLRMSERHRLAQLTVMAASARRQLKKGLDSCIDAHALSAEIVDVYLTLQDLEGTDHLRDCEGRLIETCCRS